MDHPATPPCTACPACDLLLRQPPDDSGVTFFCPRCGKTLHKTIPQSVEKVLAFSLAGLLLFIPANFMPLVTMSILGLEKHSSIFDSVLALYDQGLFLVGSTVLSMALLFPLVTLGLLCIVSLGIATGRRSLLLLLLFRGYHYLTEWAMMDVYLIGIFVTIIKLSGMAKVHFDFGLFCFIGMVITAIAAQSCLSYQEFWQRLDPEHRQPPQAPYPARTAREAGLVLCHTCQLLTADHPGGGQECRRCRSPLHMRKHDSLTRTWAMIICAVILLLPANLMPIMEVEHFGLPDHSTILDGIVYFFHSGSYAIGLIIFTASVVVPLFKIVGIVLILISIHFKLHSWLRHKALMFRFIAFIGRWSMLDIFVIALLSALVQFGVLSTIQAAPAAFYFTGVVLSTMLAAITFDSRVLWDIDISTTEETLHGKTSRS